MPKFRKKPVVIEARQFDGSARDGTSILEWMEGPILTGESGYWQSRGDGNVLVIHTLEGDHRANPNDWIIRGVKGEFYPIKPDIFAETYEMVENETP